MSDYVLELESSRVSSGRIELKAVPHPRDPDAAERATWHVALKAGELSTEITAPESPDEERTLAEYFEWLYEGQRGFWDEPRCWQSEFGALQMSAMHDDINSVTLTISLRGGVLPQWTAIVAMPMDPGRFHRLALNTKLNADASLAADGSQPDEDRLHSGS